MQKVDRRQFLGQCVQSTVAIAAATSIAQNSVTGADTETTGASRANPIAAFTKSFQDRSIPEVCQLFKKIGLDGLDLTVRPKGHIEPKDVERALPKAVDAAEAAGVKIMMLTTAITDADDDADRLLRTAADCGINRIKLGYYRYDEFGALKRQIAETRERIASVVKLANQYGVLPCIHTHSGPYLPSHGTLLYEMIRDFSPKQVGAYVDSLHMTLEGGRDGWRQGLDLLAPWIALCAIKNFAWEEAERDASGQMRWQTKVVPVADGIAAIPDFVACLKKLDFSGVFSLHSEYKGKHSFKDLTTDECVAQTSADLKFFLALL